jgi:hypothetical protein
MLKPEKNNWQFTCTPADIYKTGFDTGSIILCKVRTEVEETGDDLKMTIQLPGSLYGTS